MKFAYINNTGTDVSTYHNIIVEATKVGHLPKEFADIFTLTCTAGEWVLDWA